MSLTAKQPEQKEFEKVPEGSHIARCVGIIDVGTQIIEWAGKEKFSPKVYLKWEIPSERIVFTDKEGKEQNLPMTISKKYTRSLSEKAKLRPDLESWRGKAFTAEELDGFDLKNVLGVPCMLSVVHETSKDGSKVYANVASVMKLPKGMEAPAQECESVVYDIDAHDQEVFDKLPKYYQELINQSQERTTQSEKSEVVEYPTDDDVDPSQIPF